MSDCIGTGCKADALMQRIMAITAERDALAALLDRVLSCTDLHGWNSEKASLLCDEIDAALAKEKP